jgi:hypothetical protein
MLHRANLPGERRGVKRRRSNERSHFSASPGGGATQERIFGAFAIADVTRVVFFVPHLNSRSELGDFVLALEGAVLERAGSIGELASFLGDGVDSRMSDASILVAQ